MFATPIRELPMSLSVATAEFLRDVGATNLQDAANYMPGVTSSPDVRYPTRFIVRGFENESSILRDGYLRSVRWPGARIQSIGTRPLPATPICAQKRRSYPGTILCRSESCFRRRR